MSFWAGILLISGENDLQQNKNLLGKRFSHLAADGDTFLVSCSDGVFSFSDHETAASLVSDIPCKSLGAGKGFAVAIHENGSIYTWGTSGDAGQLAHGPQNRKIFQPLEVKYNCKIKSTSCGESHCLALDEDGTAHTWGDNSERQLNIYTKSKDKMSIGNAMIEEVIFSPRIVPWTMKMKLKEVSCGKRFTAVVTTDGKAFSWGAGECGQLGTGRCTMRDLPVEISFPADNTNISSISCGDGHCLAISVDNTCFSWGLNQRGQLGLLDFRARHTPHIVDTPTKLSKVFCYEHCSAAIDMDGRLLTWGSTSHDRLLQFSSTAVRPAIEVPDEPFVPPAKNDFVYGINAPTSVNLPGTEGLKFEYFCFSKTKSAAMVRTKLLEVSPTKGPKRTFSNLLIRGYGLWESSNIIVKFTSKVYSIYNPPRAVMGKLVDGFTIACKPPKFAEVGGYTVTVSMDGGEIFLPESFDINVYKEVSITQQSPPILDLRSPFIDRLVLKIRGSKNLLSSQEDSTSDESDQGIAIKASLYRINESGNNTLVKEFPFRGHLLSDGLPPQNIPEDPSRPTTSQSESAGHNASASSTESDFIVECRHVSIPFDESFGLGLYEMVCSISFNNQDYSGGSISTANQKHGHQQSSSDNNNNNNNSSTSTICHSFQPLEAKPNCYAVSELETVRQQVQAKVQAYLKDMSDAGFSIPGSHATTGSMMGSDAGSLNGQDANPMEHIPMDQIYGELRQYDRKIVLRARSLFPQHKLPKNAHIKARIDAIKVVPVAMANRPADSGEAQIRLLSEGISEHLDPLLVYTDSMELAHFTMTTAFLKLLDDYLETALQPAIDRSTHVVTLQWYFYLESQALTSSPAAAAGGGSANSNNNHNTAVGATTSSSSSSSSSSMMRLCEEPLDMIVYPANPLQVQPTAMKRHPEVHHADSEGTPSSLPPRTVTLSCDNLLFRPNAAVLRIHFAGAKDKEKESMVVDQKNLRFVENMARIAKESSSVRDDETPSAEEDPSDVVEYVQGYSVQYHLPEYGEFTRKWGSYLSQDDGHSADIDDILFSLSLDGHKIPSEENWGKLSFFSDLSKYTLQTPVPKGGFTPSTAITLLLEKSCPMLPIVVRLRGADETKAVVINGQMTSQGGSPPTITFSLPDAAGIAANPPFTQGKEKLYYADISGDSGTTFDVATHPLIPLK